MRKSITRVNTQYLAIIFSFFFMVCAGSVLSEPVKKVAIIPLQMNSAQDLTFLQKGLFSMLSSRLADPGKVEALERQTIDNALSSAQFSAVTKDSLNESKARLIGIALGVDHILFGSITMFGNSASLDISMVDVKDNKPVLTFSKQTKQPGAVITEMDSIATQINLKVYNRMPETFLPEESYAKKEQPYQPGVVERGILTNFNSLMTIKDEIIAVCSADVTGDKKTEIVVAYDHGIEIFKDNLKGRLKSIKKIEGPQYLDVIGIDAADIDKNGKAEIFITRIRRETGDLESQVLEYDSRQFLVRVKKLGWYLRITNMNSERETPVLYGQKKGPFGPYSGGRVFKMQFENGDYVPGDVLRVPDGFNVMSLVSAQFFSEEKPGFLYTDRKGRLVIFNDLGKVEWKSDYGFGGSKLFYHFAKKDDHLREVIVEKTDRRGVFFQPGNIVADVDADGKKEVIAIKNHDSAENTFKEVRRFKKGSIDILSWSEMGLTSAYIPKNLPGQITGISTADFNDDGIKELIVTMIRKKSNFDAKNSRSVILAYDFFTK